jgi:antitoxin component YwqK of YwqJK toxin-antitoxin module
MKNKIYYILVLLNINISCFSQEYKFVYYLDSKLVTTNKKAALLIGKGKVEDGAFKLDCYNKKENNLVITIHFTDSSLNEMNGGFISFYKNGIVENEGNYLNDLEEGIWIKRDTLGLMTDSSIYKKGIKLSYAKFGYSPSKKLYDYQFTDSLKNTYQYISFDSTSGKKNAEVNFIGNNGIYNKYDSGKVITKNVFTRELKEAKCKGFKSHLEKNLIPSIGMDNGIKAGLYQVIINFVVDVDGSISNIVAETKFGYGLEAEAIRVIKNSPEWSPAVFFGIPVKAFRRQPITFLYPKY